MRIGLVAHELRMAFDRDDALVDSNERKPVIRDTPPR